MTTEIFGYLSGIAILASFVPYIRDILLNKTKPERMSWLIWGILGFIAFFSQFAKGGTFSIIMTGAQAIGDTFIFILAIRWGMGGFLKRDLYALVGAVSGLILWLITKEAAIALFIVIFIDGIGAFLTVLKSYEKPKTETISSWVLTFIAGFLACLSVGELNFVLLAFPLYITFAGLSIFTAIKLGERKNLPVASRI